jgi:hypothetical protein
MRRNAGELIHDPHGFIGQLHAPSRERKFLGELIAGNKV